MGRWVVVVGACSYFCQSVGHETSEEWARVLIPWTSECGWTWGCVMRCAVACHAVLCCWSVRRLPTACCCIACTGGLLSFAVAHLQSLASMHQGPCACVPVHPMPLQPVACTPLRTHPAFQLGCNLCIPPPQELWLSVGEQLPEEDEEMAAELRKIGGRFLVVLSPVLLGSYYVWSWRDRRRGEDGGKSVQGRAVEREDGGACVQAGRMRVAASLGPCACNLGEHSTSSPAQPPALSVLPCLPCALQALRMMNHASTLLSKYR